MTFAVVLILLVVGSVIFHFWSPWWFTPIASNWGTIDDTVNITFWITGIVFVAINLFVAYCIIKFRYRKDRRAEYDPENKALEWWLTGITSVGVMAMLAPGLFVWAKFVNVPEEATDVEVVGQQWSWSYRFPGEDGALGTVENQLISVDNPFGMVPDDPNGQDDVLVSDAALHLPLDQPVKLLLRSKDVLHNFTVAQFRVKMDLVPGLVTFIWLTPTRTGSFEVLCEELCGIAHHAMRSRVVVQEQDEFRAWLSEQPTYASLLARPDGDATVGRASYAVCAACHGAQGEGNQAMNSPKLTGLNGWYIKRQLLNFKSGVRGAHEDDVFGQQMRPMAATLVNDEAINNVIAYINTLPDNPAPPTVSGNTENGKRIYRTCGACHAPTGHGVWSANAPRLAGMTDWYLVTQLNNFKQGVRGGHAEDPHGAQMVAMARILIDAQAVSDIVAYINTL